MPFINLQEVPAIEPAPGCHMRTPHGEKLMLSYLEMDAGAQVPTHHHPHEQAGIVLSGQLALTIGDETRTLSAGEMFIVPPNVPHSAVASERTVVMDVFSPIREDYLAMRSQPKAGG